MILMNTEELCNKKEKIRLTVALKKEEAFFPPLVFTNAVYLTVAVICKGNNVALRSNSNMTTMRRSISLVLMMNFRKISGSDIRKLNTFSN